MLKVKEIFYSIQGESTFVGLPTVFIRLTGCPLRCQYCDTTYAFKGGEKLSIQEIELAVARYAPRFVTVTGGEPLAQAETLNLLKVLANHYTVTLETSGAIDLKQVDARVKKIMDVKTPGSNEADKNLYENFNYLTTNDELKFVICDKADYEWSKMIMEKYQLIGKCEILFSPSFEQVEIKNLAEWILEDKLAVRLQCQLHKYIWNNEPGR